ncbi:hypothetical protein OKA04_04195 [Luteolibacter flavescens]|uniref:HEAT repeat domain-containing protein n=1 Tax=Luteolibacter flavescens TaxID=1859460 RepID=A0ABT3FLR4_9BACT|nr:hypothetical protein [Luteolibacter flavescens]MCW1883915.1 hypothetical protein [Luteolibacter flavescens]
MNPRLTAGLGAGLLLLAAGLAILVPKPATEHALTAPEPGTTKSRDRGAISGTVAQRTERLRAIWRSVSGGRASPQEMELALDLIRTLPTSVLKELVVECAPQPDGHPDLLAAMAKRIGDLDTERGLKWLVAEAAVTEGIYEPLFEHALAGWSEGDPVTLLDAFLDDDRALEYRIRLRATSTWGDDGIAPDIVAKAAGQDPDEAWRLLAKWQRRSLGDDFFRGIDPSLAPHFAARIRDLFDDPQMPGLQHLGGTQEAWEGEQRVRRSAATAWFALDQEKALAWYAPDAPAGSVEQGASAGALGSRLYLEQPERAMAWLEGKPQGFRAAVAAELSYDLLASADVPESRLGELTVLAGWMEEERGRRRWLRDLSGALAERDQLHRLAEVTETILARMSLTEEELAILERQQR